MPPSSRTQESTAQKKGSVCRGSWFLYFYLYFFFFFIKGVGFFFWGGRESDDNQCTCVWARDFIYFFPYFRKKKGSVSQPTGKCRTPPIRLRNYATRLAMKHKNYLSQHSNLIEKRSNASTWYLIL